MCFWFDTSRFLFLLMESMAFFYAELGLVNYSTAAMLLFYCPLMLAASSIYGACCTLKRNPHSN